MVTTKRTRSSAPSPLLPTTLDGFRIHGWVCIQNLLSPSELGVLQTECDALYASQSVEFIAAQGCVLDVMAQCPMRDSDPARTDSDFYLKARSKQLKSTDDNQQQVLASLLFGKLPSVAGQLMAAFDDYETTTSAFFFNEHYVVKPPNSHVEFRWHRDDDEQLAMCVHRESIRPYVSAWCALDEVAKVNGALQFVSLDRLSGSDEESVENLPRVSSEPATAKAGDVLFFLSNVWHCSSSNESDGVRRAFYAQYSREKITARPNDASPLSFAISCGRTDSALMAENEAVEDGEDRDIKKRKSGGM